MSNTTVVIILIAIVVCSRLHRLLDHPAAALHPSLRSAAGPSNPNLPWSQSSITMPRRSGWASCARWTRRSPVPQRGRAVPSVRVRRQRRRPEIRRAGGEHATAPITPGSLRLRRAGCGGVQLAPIEVDPRFRYALPIRDMPARRCQLDARRDRRLRPGGAPGRSQRRRPAVGCSRCSQGPRPAAGLS